MPRDENSCKHGKHAWGTHQRKWGTILNIIPYFQVTCIIEGSCRSTIHKLCLYDASPALLRLPQPRKTFSDSLRLSEDSFSIPVGFYGFNHVASMESISRNFWGTYKVLKICLRKQMAEFSCLRPIERKNNRYFMKMTNFMWKGTSCQWKRMFLLMIFNQKTLKCLFLQTFKLSCMFLWCFKLLAQVEVIINNKKEGGSSFWKSSSGEILLSWSGGWS